MDLQVCIRAFAELGTTISSYIATHNQDLERKISRSQFQNAWFTPQNCELALNEITSLLTTENLTKLVGNNFTLTAPKRVAVIFSGKTPLDGFFDAVCVLLSGNNLVAKFAPHDTFLMQFLLQKLVDIEPKFANRIEICEDFIRDFQAIIADHTNPLATQYFGKYPHIFRPEKTSVAVLSDKESEQELQLLGKDVFTYFGCGKRNVTKLFVPESFDEKVLLNSFEQFNSVSMNYKYMNNYEYNKSIYLVTQQTHFDNGFLILKEDENLKPPLGVVFYQKYKDLQQVNQILTKNHNKIHYIVSNYTNFHKNNIRFGETHKPSIEAILSDYDPISFLKNL